MKEWSTALPDWEERIVRGRSLIPCAPLFPAEAAEALAVFKGLRIPDIAGTPTFGEASEQWVFDLVSAIFGAYDAERGEQLIREFMLEIAKKNTKSTVAAGIMLTATIRNWRPLEELLILAPTIEVAQNSFKPAAAMVRLDPELNAQEQGFLHVQDHLKTITHLKTKASLKVVAADTDTVSGKKAGKVLVEELWLFGKKPNAEAMLGEATGGQVSRPEGWTVHLTTQSDDPPAGVFKAKLDYFRGVRDGRIDDRTRMPILYEFPPKLLEAEAYLDPANFYVTNPNLGRSVSKEWLTEQLEQKRAAGGNSLRIFLAKHLNVEIGLNLRSDRWAGADFWEKQADKSITLETLLERSDVVVPGLDGGGLDDLFGLTVLGRDAETKDWLSWSYAWCHKSVLERRKTIAARLQDFAASGELTIVEQPGDDVAAFVGMIDRIKATGKLAHVAVDPAGLGEVVDVLAEIGVTEESGELVGAKQGYALMNSIKTAERKLANGTLWHSGSKLMAWCVGNLKIEPTATAIRATKQNAGDAKIDPVMALFDAAAFMALNPEPAGGGPSVYESRPLLLV